MDRRAVESLLGWLVSLGLVVTTLIMTPYLSADLVNPPKFLILSITGAIGLGVLLTNRKIWSFKNYKWILGTIGAFLIWQVVVLFASGANKYQQLFGIGGRNTGLITYYSLALVMISAVFAASHNALKRVSCAGIIAGFFSVGYGLLQGVGKDPLPWNNIYNPVHGFLGNPDFQSAFVGIICTIALALACERKTSIIKRAGLAVFIVIGLYTIKDGGSIQGFLVFIIGSAVIAFIFIKVNFGKVYSSGYLGLGAIGFLAIALGSLNIGPLAKFLYRSSVTVRGDYWRAAWKMTMDNPIVGVGMDSYGDWYRRSRNIDATLRSGPDGVSNAAHNVYLDISSNGGFPLLIIYMAITSLVIVSLWKVIARSQEFNPYFAAVAGAWVAYQAQSIISINQIGVAIWGWALAGVIIGFEINTRVLGVEPEKKVKSADRRSKFSISKGLAIVISLAIGLGVGLPPLVASAKFKDATESDSLAKAISAAYLSPLDVERLVIVGTNLRDNKYDKEALSIISDAVKSFPNSFDAWKTLASLPNATPAQVANAKAQMKRLDPLNPTLK